LAANITARGSQITVEGKGAEISDVRLSGVAPGTYTMTFENTGTVGSLSLPATRTGFAGTGGAGGTLNVALTGGSGTGATANVTYDTTGKITDIAVQKVGTGYKAGDILGSAALGASVATSRVTFADIAATQTIVIGGLTFTAGANGATAAQLAYAFSNITATDAAAMEEFPDDEGLAKWIHLAKERVAFQGLPARICWLGYGERHRLGLRFNEMVKKGQLKAPIVIGRDHLDSGSVASPYRETESMLDGSDAIADWPLLNALVNTASGATWVSIHHGGGVGIGRSIHAGMVAVADGTDLAGEKLARVLVADPGMGVIRHADAGYDRAIEVADQRGVRIPMREG
jgi:hypothetical protein